MTTPPGWPRAVPDPESPQIPDRVVGWMLGLCPPDYRRHEVFRRYPVVLARLAALHADASLKAARSAYAGGSAGPRRAGATRGRCRDPGGVIHVLDAALVPEGVDVAALTS